MLSFCHKVFICEYSFTIDAVLLGSYLQASVTQRHIGPGTGHREKQGGPVGTHLPQIGP